MSRNPQEPWRPPEPPGRPPRPPGSGGRGGGPLGGGNPRARWMPWVVFGIFALTLLLLFSKGIPGTTPSRSKLTFTEMQADAGKGLIATVDYNRDSGDINGKFTRAVDGKTEFEATG